MKASYEKELASLTEEKLQLEEKIALTEQTRDAKLEQMSALTTELDQQKQMNKDREEACQDLSAAHATIQEDFSQAKMQHSCSMKEIVTKINELANVEEEDPIKCVARLQERMSHETTEFNKINGELTVTIAQ